MVRIYILPNKKSVTVLNAFKEYQAWAERQAGHQSKALRTDRGTEYMGDMISYAKSIGIDHQPTAAYSPQSNGVAERCNRTLLDMACPMKDSAGAPYELWAEALLAACHIHNRLPNRTLDSISPHEAWYGRKPTVDHVRKWGCVVYRHIDKEVRVRLAPKAMKGYLVGYDSRGIYRIYHPKLKTVKSSRDIIFDESQFMDIRHAPGKTDEILISDNFSDHVDITTTKVGVQTSEPDVDFGNDSDSSADIFNAASVIYDEIVVQPPPSNVVLYQLLLYSSIVVLVATSLVLSRLSQMALPHRGNGLVHIGKLLKLPMQRNG